MKPLHLETPLLESRSLIRKVDGAVWLKMEALQPCGSFKVRGIGHACQTYVQRGAKRLICSSGGNAGLAVAYAGRRIGVPVTVVVPQTTAERARMLIELEDAEVIVHGENWNAAHARALQMVGPDAAYLHPYEDPLIWQGHSTVVDEIAAAGLPVDLIVLCVGGGGLLCGVMEGLKRNGLDNVPVLAMETRGADSFHQAVQAGRVVELPAIDSIASSLGARSVSPRALQWTHQHEIIPRTVSDREAVDACLAFARDHRLIVEPACGASLAAVYQSLDVLAGRRNVVVIVCGGVGVTFEKLQAWREQLARRACPELRHKT